MKENCGGKSWKDGLPAFPGKAETCRCACSVIIFCRYTNYYSFFCKAGLQQLDSTMLEILASNPGNIYLVLAKITLNHLSLPLPPPPSCDSVLCSSENLRSKIWNRKAAFTWSHCGCQMRWKCGSIGCQVLQSNVFQGFRAASTKATAFASEIAHWFCR